MCGNSTRISFTLSESRFPYIFASGYVYIIGTIYAKWWRYTKYMHVFILFSEREREGERFVSHSSTVTISTWNITELLSSNEKLRNQLILPTLNLDYYFDSIWTTSECHTDIQPDSVAINSENSHSDNNHFVSHSKKIFIQFWSENQLMRFDFDCRLGQRHTDTLIKHLKWQSSWTRTLFNALNMANRV